MENWVTIISFYHTMHVYLPKTKLESEGIEVMLRDELTSQINPFNSFAIGGVKLLVKEEDYDRAHDLLNEWGYHLDDNDSKPYRFLKAFDDFTSEVPIMRKWIVEMRLVVFIAVFLVLVLGLIFNIKE